MKVYIFWMLFGINNSSNNDYQNIPFHYQMYKGEANGEDKEPKEFSFKYQGDSNYWMDSNDNKFISKIANSEQ